MQRSKKLKLPLKTTGHMNSYSSLALLKPDEKHEALEARVTTLEQRHAALDAILKTQLERMKHELAKALGWTWTG